MDSLAREAARLTQEERAQAERINKLASPQGDPNKMDMDALAALRRERDRLAGERQQLSNDLSGLERNLRGTARDMARNQPGAARKLRDALTEMDESNLDNRVQRTADWLRRGINPNSNGTESQIAQGLGKLNQQLRQAQQEMGSGKPGTEGAAAGDRTAALDRIERLRSEIEALAGSHGAGRQGKQNQNGQSGPAGAQAAGNGMQRSGDVGGQRGEVHYDSGRGSEGTVWDNINTGNNRYGPASPRTAPRGDSSNLPDTERAIRQGLRELNQLMPMVRGEKQAEKEVEELAKQMQRLDPSRFPGNPAMVERMYREVLSSVDKLELQVRRDGASTEARTGKPLTVPEGYRDSVADYFRRLSKTP